LLLRPRCVPSALIGGQHHCGLFPCCSSVNAIEDFTRLVTSAPWQSD
jgi:hypothetical protein